MNAIDRFFLRLFLLPERFYAKQGVNILHLKAILTAKLTMDNRRVSSVMAQRQKKNRQQGEPNNASLKTLFSVLIIGFVMLFALVTNQDVLTRLTMFTTMFIFMLCMTLISDYTNVLIDTRDNLIILPKPVSDKTFLMARLLYIGIRISMLLIPMALPGCVAFVIMEGLWVFLPFLLIIVLMTVFSIFLINALYLIILKLTTPDKFKSIITAIQIIFVMLFFAAFQLFPRLMASETMRNTNLSDFIWIRFYPPYWFSEACLFLSGKLATPQTAIGLVLAVAVPVLSMWAVVRFLAPAFMQKITLITGSAEEKQAISGPEQSKRFKLKELYCTIFTRRTLEKAGFLFTWDMMTRSKDFKMRVLPQFGYILVFCVVLLLQNKSVETFLIMLTYMSSSTLTNAFFQVTYSEKRKAAWLFLVTPMSAPGSLIGGSVKAILAMFYLPMAVLLLLLGLVLLGPFGMVGIAMGIVNVLAYALFYAYRSYRYLPFSRQMEGTANGGGFTRTLINLLPLLVFGLLHLLIRKEWVLMAFVLLLSAVASWFLYSKITELEWDELKE